MREYERPRLLDVERTLMPCPFCGGRTQMVKSSGRWGWFVSCECAAVGPSADDKGGAIAAWNTRAGEDE